MFSKALGFFTHVRHEFEKIVWSPKKQALVVTGVVFLMVFIASLYFFLIDWVLSNIVSFLLGLGA